MHVTFHKQAARTFELCVEEEQAAGSYSRLVSAQVKNSVGYTPRSVATWAACSGVLATPPFGVLMPYCTTKAYMPHKDSVGG